MITPASHSSAEQGPNPVRIRPRERSASGSDAQASLAASLEAGPAGLSLGLAIGVIPLFIDVMARSLTAGYFVVDESSLGYAALAITFATIVRILSRSDGLAWIGILLLFSFGQAVIALMFGNAFSPSSPTSADVLNVFPTEARVGDPLTSGQVALIQELTSAGGGYPEISRLIVLIFLSITGLISTLLLAFYWLPRQRLIADSADHASPDAGDN